MVTNRCFTLALPVKQNKYCSFFLNPHSARRWQVVNRLAPNLELKEIKTIYVEERCLFDRGCTVSGSSLFVVSVKVYSGQISVESA